MRSPITGTISKRCWWHEYSNKPVPPARLYEIRPIQIRSFMAGASGYRLSMHLLSRARVPASGAECSGHRWNPDNGSLCASDRHGSVLAHSEHHISYCGADGPVFSITGISARLLAVGPERKPSQPDASAGARSLLDKLSRQDILVDAAAGQ